MPNTIKEPFIEQLKADFGDIKKIGSGNSLFQISNTDIRIYIRYSKRFESDVTFYGLRNIDLKCLDGFSSVICFLWDQQDEPLFVPYDFLGDLLNGQEPASDGQYKAQIIFRNGVTELYLPKLGRFNVESYFGWDELHSLLLKSNGQAIPNYSHYQIQTLLGAIGTKKNFDIYVPLIDRTKLDWSIAEYYKCRDIDFIVFEKIKRIIQEVDVIWIKKGSSEIQALFEVEHSTPVYSGLLRFNDIRLVSPNLHARFSVVSNTSRNSLFIRQISRPTFVTSGLNEICTFLDYENVYKWNRKLSIVGV